MAVFPSLIPRFADGHWFNIDKRLDDDAALTKEEDDYNNQLHAVVEKGNDIVPLGKSKESNEGQEGEEEEMEDEEDSAEELEDDTDDYESPSPDAESVEGEVEMMDSSFI